MKIVSRARNPRAATEAERRDHEDQGHVQFRDWCVICHAARGTGQPGEELDLDPALRGQGYRLGQRDCGVLAVSFTEKPPVHRTMFFREAALADALDERNVYKLHCWNH